MVLAWRDGLWQVWPRSSSSLLTYALALCGRECRPDLMQVGSYFSVLRNENSAPALQLVELPFRESA